VRALVVISRVWVYGVYIVNVGRGIEGYARAKLELRHRMIDR